MAFRIVADSGVDLYDIPGECYCTVPLKIISEAKEYADTADLNISKMLEEIKALGGKTSSSCPSVGEWQNAFEGYDEIFAIPCSQGMSGSLQSAHLAAEAVRKDNPDVKIHIVDCLTAGPGMRLIVERIVEDQHNGMSFEQTAIDIDSYIHRVRLYFSLHSVMNFARNGRFNPVLAKGIGLLNIRIICGVTTDGKIAPLHKARGTKKELEMLVNCLEENHFTSGKVRITHAFNLEGAKSLQQAVLRKFPAAQILIAPMGGLCSFYAENEGLLIAFEN